MAEDKRYITLLPGGEPEIHTGPLELKMMQEFVKGYIEIVDLNPFEEPADITVSIVINEEGKLNHMQPNCHWFGDVLVGPIIFTAYENENGESVTLTDEMIERVNKFIKENQIKNKQ